MCGHVRAIDSIALSTNLASAHFDELVRNSPIRFASYSSPVYFRSVSRPVRYVRSGSVRGREKTLRGGSRPSEKGE